MTTTQYIGARYVPLFASPLDWDSTQAYDALTIVYYAGNSYTSRQAVPAGIQITNEDYWALTGNYNAQIEQYRAEVKAYDERISTADTTANDALSLAQTNEKDIATLDSEMAGTAESGLKTLISTSVATETSRAESKESKLADSISAEQTRATNKESELTASISAEQTRAESKESELNTAITNEVSRATALENTLQSEVNTNAEAISSINAKFPIATNNIADKAVTKDKVDLKLDSTYKIVMIGDSYADAEVDANTWTWQLQQKMPNATFYNYAVSGGGFTASTTFITQLRNAAAALDTTEITHVIIAGGRNDIYSDGYGDAVYSCLQYAKSNFANALVVVVPMLWDYSPITATELDKASVIANAGSTSNCCVLNYAWIWNKGDSSFYQSDKIHPNASGASRMATYIRNGIMGTYMPRYIGGQYKLGSADIRFEIIGGLCHMRLNGNTGSSTTTSFPSVYAPVQTTAGVAYYNGGNNFCVTFASAANKDSDPTFSLYGISSSNGTGCSMTWLV